MKHEPRHLLDAAPLRRILILAALVMLLMGAVESVEMARQMGAISPVQQLDELPAAQDEPTDIQLVPGNFKSQTELPHTQPTLVEQSQIFIEPFEGRRHLAYNDSRGNRTIGVGFNLDRAGAESDINRLLPGVSYRALRLGDATLTDAQVDVLFQNDVQRAIDTAGRQVTGFEDLPDGAKLVIIDMTYNIGSLGRWRKLRAALARSDFTAAANAMHRSTWRRQTGHRAAGHIELMHSLAQG